MYGILIKGGLKEMKKIIIVLGAIVSVFIMTSVVTAVPHINSKTINENNILLSDFEGKVENIKLKSSTPAQPPQPPWIVCFTLALLATIFINVPAIFNFVLWLYFDLFECVEFECINTTLGAKLE